MDRVAWVLAGLLGRSAGLLPAARREWAQAVLAEAGEVPARSHADLGPLTADLSRPPRPG